MPLRFIFASFRLYYAFRCRYATFRLLRHAYAADVLMLYALNSRMSHIRLMLSLAPLRHIADRCRHTGPPLYTPDVFADLLLYAAALSAADAGATLAALIFSARCRCHALLTLLLTLTLHS